MNRSWTTPLHMVLIALALPACAADGPNGAMAVDTSASGVITVRNRGGAASEAESWRLERVVRIGTVAGDEHQQFGRISDVAMGPDSLVYVLEAQAREVRVFDLTGAHVRTIGGQGAGPGEFQLPMAIAFDRDGNLWVADYRARAFSIFSASGEFIASRRNPVRPGPYPDVRIGSDGSIFTFGPSTLVRRNVIRLAGDEELVAVDTVFLPSFEWAVFRGRRVGSEVFAEPIPFAPVQVSAIGPAGEVWLAPGDIYRIIQVRDSADTVRVIELDAEAAPLSEADQRIADSVVRKAESEDMDVDRARIPARHPFATGIVISSDGHVWLRRPDGSLPLRPDGTRAHVYDVFSPDGRHLATLPAPDDGYPRAYITDRHLVGIERDSLDVQYVEVHRIVRPEG